MRSVAPPRASRIRRSARPAVRALGDRRAWPDATWLARVSGAAPDEVEAVLSEAADLIPLEREIRAAYAAVGAFGFAQIRAPFELYAMVRLRRPEVIVEAGVSSGVSSAHFLAGLQRNRKGRLYSIDLPTFQRGPRRAASESPVSIPPGRTSGWAVPSRLRGRWELTVGPSEQELPRLARRLSGIDLFLHDDRHTPRHLTFELSTVRPKLRSGAIVLADNTVWTGDSFPRFARSVGVPYFRRRRSDLVGLRLGG